MAILCKGRIMTSSVADRRPLPLQALLIGFLILWIVVAAFPFVWTLWGSFKVEGDFFSKADWANALTGPMTQAETGGAVTGQGYYGAWVTSEFWRAGLNTLIVEAPDFAEAWNQRAILNFKAKRFEEAIHDCEKTLQLNPWHFGAQAGMAQAYMHMRRHAAALRAFRAAHRINPHMDGIVSTIRLLEKALDEGSSAE